MKKTLSPSEEIHVSFEVKKIKYHDEKSGFTVADIIFKEYLSDYIPTNDPTVVGSFISIFEGDEFEGKGKWSKHEIYGYRFELSESYRVIPQTKKGIEAFIRRFVKGVGSKTAKDIVDTLGENALRLIEEDWKNLLKVNGIGKKRAMKIHESIIKNTRFDDIAMFVLNYGGNYRLALRVYETFREGAISKIRENPYVLTKIKDITFPIADRFAHALKFPFNHPERIREGILYMLNTYAEKRGDLYITESEIQKKLYDFLMRYGMYPKEEVDESFQLEDINEALRDLHIAEKITSEKNNAGEMCVYLRKYHYIEEKIVEHLKRLIEEEKEPLCSTAEIDAFINDYEEEHSIKFAKQQKEAIHMGLTQGISILTGGPGTGKTQVINAIIKCLQYYKPTAEVHLSAPTGKACKRMSEVTGMEAKTIHRLTGLNAFEKENTLVDIEGDLLIVDESSMVDAYVMYKMLSCIDNDVRILLVGDYDQLPPVGPGLIFRDFIQSKRIPTTTLTEIFRQAKESQIITNSHKVKNGIKTTDPNSYSFDNKKGDFYFIKRKEITETKNTILACMKRLIEKYNYSLSDIQVLSPIRKGDLGIWILNQEIQEMFNPRDVYKNEYRFNEQFTLREGDKVIQTVNRYDKDVLNGDVGIVSEIYENDEGETIVVVEFDESRTVEYEEYLIPDLEHAFVTSIHKSQGSEYPVVIMPIHPLHDGFLNRNAIYTGWTRAKKAVISIGQLESLDKAVEHTDNTVRNSLIKEKIIKNIQPKTSVSGLSEAV